MVRFRGIDVSIVSQFDVRKLPEFRPYKLSTPFHQNSVASCYVPIYPGSQIWFHYSVDPPHPPYASYFFKLVHNGKVVTSWDCTAKHGYHGKTAYHIEYVGSDKFTGLPLVKRQAFKFSPRCIKEDVCPFDDCIEFKIYRIDRRQRIPIEVSLKNAQALESKHSGGLCLVNGGLLEPGCLPRRYRYQLVDPTDEPYATIRFYYRSYAFLEDHKIVYPYAKPCRPTSASSSGHRSEPSISLLQKRLTPVLEYNHPRSVPRNRGPVTTTTPPPARDFHLADEDSHGASFEPEKEPHFGKCISAQGSEESLRIVRKASLDDLHASIVRVVQESSVPATDDLKEIVGDYVCITTPKKLPKKSSTLKIDGADFELEIKRCRPLSPFNGAGALRKTISPTPPSAPAAVNEFGSTIAEEVKIQLAREKERRKLAKAQDINVSTTGTERHSKSLLGFLGKRIGRTNEVKC